METKILTSDDREAFQEAVRLLNRTQGEGLFPSNYLEQRTSDPRSLVVAAFEDSRLAGIGVAQLIDDFEFYLPFDREIREELANRRVGSFSTLAVREDLQGRGIGQEISKIRLRWLREKGCEVILGVSWVSGLGHTSDRVFERMEFRPVKLVEHFFREMSLEKPFDCPGCQAKPCACSAILYRWP